MTKVEILKQALEYREQEVLHHQINIDNYILALEEIEINYKDDKDLIGFKEQLQNLLSSSIIEQRKEIIMRNVIKKQVEELCSIS